MFVVVPLVRLYRVLAVQSSLLAKRLRERVSVKAGGARECTTLFFPFFFFFFFFFSGVTKCDGRLCLHCFGSLLWTR